MATVEIQEYRGQLIAKAVNGDIKQVRADVNGALTTTGIISGTQISTDINVAFANNASANTQQNVTFTKPSSVLSEYKIVVWNPSTVTDLTIKVMDVDAVNGDSLITTLSIPKKQTITGTNVQGYTNLIHGIFIGSDCKLVISNDTALGSSGGFSAIVRVREVI